MTGGKSRRKGATFEREIGNALFDLLGAKFARDLRQYQTTDLGDLVCDDPSFPFVIECKRYAASGSNRAKPEWWAQVCRAAAVAGKEPALIYRYDRSPVRVMLPLRVVLEGATNETIETDLEAFAFIARETWNEK